VSDFFTLITGRTAEQGRGLHEGKRSEAYWRAVNLVEMNQEDMTRMGIEAGRMVRVRTDAGEVRVPVHAATLPSRVIFIPMGPVANELIGGDTEASGMPAFKGLLAEVELA
jgi:formylmethanofuran dehydrogenase subunit D